MICHRVKEGGGKRDLEEGQQLRAQHTEALERRGLVSAAEEGFRLLVSSAETRRLRFSEGFAFVILLQQS